MKWLRYAWYVARHKWFVFVECCKLGEWWLGIIHDWSKFHPAEFFPYADHFYGKRTGAQRDKTGYYKPTDTGDPAFDIAWLYHQHANKHHWQWWCSPEKKGLTCYEIPLRYRREMLADWRGAGKAQGTPNTVAWYVKNGNKMYLGPETRRWIEEQLDDFKERQ